MDYEIVNEYMARKYSAYTWVLKQGNNCVWVTMNNLNMYFTIKDNKIIDIQVDQDYIMYRVNNCLIFRSLSTLLSYIELNKDKVVTIEYITEYYLGDPMEQ